MFILVDHASMVLVYILFYCIKNLIVLVDLIYNIYSI